jgi:hypothetical protein
MCNLNFFPHKLIINDAQRGRKNKVIKIQVKE